MNKLIAVKSLIVIPAKDRTPVRGIQKYRFPIKTFGNDRTWNDAENNLHSPKTSTGIKRHTDVKKTRKQFGEFPTSMSCAYFQNINILQKSFISFLMFILLVTYSYSFDKYTAGYITVGSYPIDMVMNKDATRIYVANEGSNLISVIDATTNTVLTSIPVGSKPTAMVFSRDESKLYVTNNNSGGAGSVSVVSLTNNIVTNTISVGNGPIGIDITPDGKKLFVANYGSLGVEGNTLTVINTENETVDTTVVLTIGVAKGPKYVAVRKIYGDKVYVTNFKNDGFNYYLSVVRTSDYGVDTTVNIGAANQPLGIRSSKDGTKVYVTIPNNNKTSVYNSSTYQKMYDMSVSTEPRDIRFDREGVNTYITHNGINRIYVFDSNDSNTDIITNSFIDKPNICVVHPSNRIYTVSYNSGPQNVIIFEKACADSEVSSSSFYPTIKLPIKDYYATIDGTKLYFTTSADSYFHIYSLTLDTELAGIDAGGLISSFTISPDEKTAYLSLYYADALKSLDLGSFNTTTIISGDSMGQIAVYPSGTKFYVGCPGNNTVYGVSYASSAVTDSFSAGGSSPYGVGITPDGNTLVSAGYNGNACLFDVMSRSLVTQVGLTNSHREIVVGSGGRTGVIMNADTSVNIVYFNSLSFGVTIAIDSIPRGSAVSPDDKWIYASMGNDSIAVIDVKNNRFVRTFSTGQKNRKLYFDSNGYLNSYEYSDTTIRKIEIGHLPPFPPKITYPTGNACVQATVNWNAPYEDRVSSSYITYNIQICPDDQYGVWSDVVDTSSAGISSYFLPSNTHGNKYFLRIRAYDGKQWGGYYYTDSFAVSYTAPPDTPLPPVTEIVYPSAPTVTSTTHPSESVSYKATIITLQWTKPASNVTGYYYVFDKNESTNPDKNSNYTANTTLTFYNLNSGTWYFHVISIDDSGYLSKSATHRKIIINVTGSISGKITDENGEPVKNVKIEVIQNKTVIAYTFTKDDGTYIVETLSNGKYSLKVSKDGYVYSESGEVEVTESSNVSNANFSMKTFGRKEKGFTCAYPLPATGSSLKVTYYLEKDGEVVLNFFNTRLGIIHTKKENGKAEYNTTEWQIDDVAPGVYYYQVAVTNSDGTYKFPIKKILIVK